MTSARSLLDERLEGVYHVCMAKRSSIEEQIKVASVRILFLPHAVRQMARPERMIRPLEVRGVVESGQIIEDYPNDPRGHSCLMLGFGDENRPVHVVCAPKEEYLAVITAYLPDADEWHADFKVRRKS
jgi:hypothetical protein